MLTALSADEKIKCSGKITRLILPYLQGVNSVFIYLATENEVDTLPLIYKLLEMGIIVYTPKTDGDEMRLIRFDENSTVVKGRYGISEVEGSAEEFYGADVNIIPLVAYDKNLNRCGHGKGYYDKYLARAQAKIYRWPFSTGSFADRNVSVTT